MNIHALLATVLLATLPVASQAAATEEPAPLRQQEVSEAAPNRDTAASPIEARVVPENLQAARKTDELPFSDIRILPSF